MLFFPYETLDLVCFYAFLYFSGIELPFVHNRVDGPGACFPGKIWTFLNVRSAGFWHSGRLFTLLQMPSLQNFKNFFGDPPFKPTMFFWPPPFPAPLKPYFFHDPASNPTSPHYLIKNERSVIKEYLAQTTSPSYSLALTRFILSYNNVV